MTDKKWDQLTEEEREEYVNQDCRKRNWNENLEAEMGRTRFQRAIDTNSLADVFPSSPEWLDDALEQILTPFGRVCFREYYINGKTYQEIADSMTVGYQVEGVTFETKPVTFNMVHRELRKSKALIKAYMDKCPQNP
jgi:hypothetical protein